VIIGDTALELRAGWRDPLGAQIVCKPTRQTKERNHRDRRSYPIAEAP
jgi:hypothetical protein